jgi:hypothetical protein
MKKITNFFTVDKYYQMSDLELEQEAAKYKIGDYVDTVGGEMRVNRKLIIEQLISKDGANSAKMAIIISVVALMFSFIALFK